MGWWPGTGAARKRRGELKAELEGLTELRGKKWGVAKHPGAASCGVRWRVSRSPRPCLPICARLPYSVSPAAPLPALWRACFAAPCVAGLDFTSPPICDSLPRPPPLLRQGLRAGHGGGPDGLACDHEFHAAVLLPTLGGLVRSDGLSLAEAARRNRSGRDPLLNKEVSHRGSAPFGKLLVELFAPNVIGMPLDLEI